MKTTTPEIWWHTDSQDLCDEVSKAAEKFVSDEVRRAFEIVLDAEMSTLMIELSGEDLDIVFMPAEIGDEFEVRVPIREAMRVFIEEVWTGDDLKKVSCHFAALAVWMAGLADEADSGKS